MRKTIISLSGILILVLGFLGFKALSESKKTPSREVEKFVNSVYAADVQNTAIPIALNTSGSVVAKDRMVLYSEVQGVFMPPSKSYKAGVNYSAGERMISINNEEFRASVVAQRSLFVNLITAILPDIQFDYPPSLDKWKMYLNSIDIQKNLPALPTIEEEGEKNYIVGKKVNSTFYSIKNLETRLKKYTIAAPYSGILVEANVTPGTLISPGQKLGEFIRPAIFELELNVNANLQNLLRKGKTVKLHNIERTKEWQGKVTRINDLIDRGSQTIKIFVEVRAKDLKEGEYLEATIDAKEVENAIEIPRTLLIDNKAVYLVEENKLKLENVNVVHSNLNTVVITGLKEGSRYVSKPVSGAFDGMEVKVID